MIARARRRDDDEEGVDLPGNVVDVLIAGLYIGSEILVGDLLDRGLALFDRNARLELDHRDDVEWLRIVGVPRGFRNSCRAAREVVDRTDRKNPQ
jgi:hypothetical protein